MDAKGFHYLIDITLEQKTLLLDAEQLMNIFEQAINLDSFNILKNDFYKFNSQGYGVTGFFILSESHLSFHTYPEINYISIDLYTCGRKPNASIKYIIDTFNKYSIKNIISSCLIRGNKSNDETNS